MEIITKIVESERSGVECSIKAGWNKKGSPSFSSFSSHTGSNQWFTIYLQIAILMFMYIYIKYILNYIHPLLYRIVDYKGYIPFMYVSFFQSTPVFTAVYRIIVLLHILIDRSLSLSSPCTLMFSLQVAHYFLIHSSTPFFSIEYSISTSTLLSLSLSLSLSY